MTDQYFIGKIAEYRRDMRDRTHSLTDLVAELEGKQYVGPLNSMSDIQIALALAEQEASKNNIIKTGVPLINSVILSRYHSHARIEIKNAQFERAENLVRHYNNLSCQTYFKNSSGEFIFNAKHLKPWKKLGISERCIVEVYAHDLRGNPKRAENLVVKNMLRLLGEENSEKDQYAHYVHREVEILGSHGLHARPSARLVKLANQYAGEVFVKNCDQYIDAKNIMGLMTSEIQSGTTINIIYEPGFGETSQLHRDIEKALAIND
jgi:phosphocarrier protein